MSMTASEARQRKVAEAQRRKVFKQHPWLERAKSRGGTPPIPNKKPFKSHDDNEVLDDGSNWEEPIQQNVLGSDDEEEDEDEGESGSYWSWTVNRMGNVMIYIGTIMMCLGFPLKVGHTTTLALGVVGILLLLLGTYYSLSKRNMIRKNLGGAAKWARKGTASALVAGATYAAQGMDTRARKEYTRWQESKPSAKEDYVDRKWTPPGSPISKSEVPHPNYDPSVSQQPRSYSQQPRSYSPTQSPAGGAGP